ncbi:MAG: hypothetical protein ACLFTA_02995 [Candidatus Nanohaloarchaea archaeon]
MSKFWAFAAIILMAGLAGVLAAAEEDINFTDLETECREDRAEDFQVSVKDNKLFYSGFFPVQSTEADMRYSYSRSGDTVKLNVKSVNEQEPENFEENCYATGVYKASTQPLNGRYTVVTQHNGERVDKRIIDFK